VVMGPVSFNGNEPVVTKVRNVTDAGFEFQLDEWDYLDGKHVAETVSWLAIEAGHHVLADGSEIHAGSQAINGQSWVDFGDRFTETPLVFAQYGSESGPTMADRISSVSTSGFGVGLSEQEANHSLASNGALSWIAMSAGGSAAAGALAGRTGKAVSHKETDLDLGDAFGDNFVFIADMQTRHGWDPSALRLTDKEDGGVSLFVEEERSADAEQSHTNEDVAYLAIHEGLIYADIA
jgi:hypothetical protein